MKRTAFYVLAILVFALDRATKVWAVGALSSGNTVSLVPGYLRLSIVLNHGSAFGIIRSGSAGLALLAAIAIAVMVWVERKGLPNKLVMLAVALELGGALGNLSDRIRFGHVVDFVELDWHGQNIWPVFNVADSAITAGAILLCWWIWRSERRATALGAPDA
jgi:signal peptidase II